MQEYVTRDLTVTIFCTNKICGRYDIDDSALQALLAGARLRPRKEKITSEVYAANRKGERILITAEYLETQSEPML